LDTAGETAGLFGSGRGTAGIYGDDDGHVSDGNEVYGGSLLIVAAGQGETGENVGVVGQPIQQGFGQFKDGIGNRGQAGTKGFHVAMATCNSLTVIKKSLILR
jgi:hypothetical protein